MIGQVAALRQGACSLRELHEEVCLGAVETARRSHAASICCRRRSPCGLSRSISPSSACACLVPGATDPSRLWHNVLAKFDPITEIPADRFEVDRWFDGDRKARDKIYGRWGGFVDDLPFDPLKYGIPPASIPSIEPMQLLAMELVDRALTDAGYAPHNPLARTHQHYPGRRRRRGRARFDLRLPRHAAAVPREPRRVAVETAAGVDRRQLRRHPVQRCRRTRQQSL